MVASKQCPSCGLVVDESTHVCQKLGNVTDSFPQVDDQFRAKYQVLETVGAGGMGVIYKARHNILNRIVAVKMVHAHIVSPEVIKRFYHEGKASSSLSHPYIVKVLDFGTTESGQPYMILDYVHGKTLSKVLATEGSLSTERFIRLFLQICEALSYAHKNWVLHRDIKPANIMLVENSRGEEEIRIMDFGLAKIIDDTEYASQHLTKTGVAMGSPLYMSPEHARGSNMDERSDLYSLGCTMYEALTGTPPFMGKTPFETLLMHLNEAPLPLGEASLGKTIDPRIEQIVLKTLEKNLTDRYQSMEELRKDLLKISNPPVADLPITGQTRSGKAKSLILAGTLAGAMTIVGVCCFQTTHSGPKPATSESSALSSPTITSEHAASPLASPTITPQHAASPSLDSSTVASNHNATDSLGSSTIASDHAASASLGSSNIASDHASKPNHTDLVKNQSSAKTSSSDTPFDLLAEVTPKQLVESRVQVPNSSIIDLSKNSPARISDGDLEPLSEAQWTSRIVLKGLPISDAGLKYLSKLKLKSLDLESTRVKDLGALQSVRSLVDLSVARTFLSAKGMKTIGALSELKTLNLSATKIADRDLRSLYGLRKLELVNLSGCENLGENAVKKLENVLEPCKVSFFHQALSDYEPFTLAKDAALMLASGDWKKGYEKFTSASRLLTNSADQDLKARCLYGAGDCKFMGRDLASAADLYNQAALILDKYKPTNSITAEVYTKKAFTQELLNNPAEAIKSRMKADEIYKHYHGSKQEAMQIADLRAENLLHASFAGAKMGQPIQAASQFKLALSILPEQKRDSEIVAQTSHAIGTSFIGTKKYNNAIPFLERTLGFYKSNYPKYQESHTLLEQLLAETYNSAGRYKEAEAILKHTVDQPANRGLRDRRFSCLTDTLRRENKNSEAASVERRRNAEVVSR